MGRNGPQSTPKSRAKYLLLIVSWYQNWGHGLLFEGDYSNVMRAIISMQISYDFCDFFIVAFVQTKFKFLIEHQTTKNQNDFIFYRFLNFEPSWIPI